MSSPISGGGSPIQPIPIHPHKESNAEKEAGYIQKNYLNLSPPHLNGLYNYLLNDGGKYLLSQLGISNNEITALMKALVDYKNNPSPTNQASAFLEASGLVNILKNKH